ncbi:hypothetical protein QRQ56_22560 [Bradyrhizobium sp. U531]
MGRANRTKGQGHVHSPRAGRRVGKRHSALRCLRLIVKRQDEADAMTLKAETSASSDALREGIAGTLRAVTKLGRNVELVSPGRAAERRESGPDER